MISMLCASALKVLGCYRQMVEGEAISSLKRVMNEEMRHLCMVNETNPVF